VASNKEYFEQFVKELIDPPFGGEEGLDREDFTDQVVFDSKLMLKFPEAISGHRIKWVLDHAENWGFRVNMAGSDGAIIMTMTPIPDDVWETGPWTYLGTPYPRSG
jgi:hypothetical protein